MAQFLLFVYSLIIFLSLFFGEAAFERTETRMLTIPCTSDANCPKVISPCHTKCFDGFCGWYIEGSYEGP
ncbi:Nodule Cysteine-Rich (NCR) secreted peptide [Medicago truncatula]|uniref:Nodule Cysteine-Rich (NCR) secreted peptide n=2 Tax=Medicago truncatula TaxID=3880 RepID=A0A072UKX9_MEDTR|nr:Nodule Cysteine-Rich (NCR) secreted peptide [Medicago truncatula]